MPVPPHPARPARRGAARLPDAAGRPVTLGQRGAQALGNRARGALLGRTRPPARRLVVELGRQPDPYLRAVLQSALGRDLGDVRVRSGPAAEAVLDAQGSDAATRGQEVLVRPEHEHATTNGTRALLLHELVHVLQQVDRPALGGGAGPDPGLAVQLESQAETVARGLVGAPAPAPAAR